MLKCLMKYEWVKLRRDIVAYLQPLISGGNYNP